MPIWLVRSWREQTFGIPPRVASPRSSSIRRLSYADKKLRGIGLGNNDLTRWDFSDQDLSYANIVGAMLTNANLAGANLFGADLREAEGFSPAASTTTRNAIWPDGQIRRLELRAGEYLPIGFFRDFEAGTPVEDVFAAADGATLEVLIGNFGELFDPYPVSSRLLLGSHVPVELGGSLRVVWEDGGFPKRGSYDLFDWPGPLEPDNVFSFLELPPGAWDVSQLYNSGQITLTDEYRDDGDFDADGLLGADDIDRLSTAVRAGRDLSYDANGDGLLNQDDRRLWVEELQDTFIGDANFDGVVNAADLNELALNWRAAKPAANTIPEPRGIALAAISLVAFSVLGRIRQDALIATKSR